MRFLATCCLCGVVGAQQLARHSLPVSQWRMNSRNYLQAGDARSFSLSEQTGDADRLLCQVGSVISAGLPGRLPRKELFEAHAVASVANRYFPSHLNIVEPCAGCGLLAVFLVLLNRHRHVRCSDKQRPRIARELSQCVEKEWPFLAHQIRWEEADLRKSTLTVAPSELIVSCHACSFLSDEMIRAAEQNRRPLVLVPCCYETQPNLPDRPWLPNWSWRRWPWLLEGETNRLGRSKIHEARLEFLKAKGYDVVMDEIDRQITEMNRVIIARPA
ncbi:unnamed protein product [Symbiodinium sp. CCMP2592]|nr:unnamed protein product [Symbiodinium sp. CCMP2592]